MFIIRRTKIFFALTLTTVLLALASVFSFGLNPSIDFAGGSLLEVQYEGNRPAVLILREAVGETFPTAVIQSVDTHNIIVKVTDMTDAQKQTLLGLLTVDGEFAFTELRYKSISPTISDELKNKALFALFLVVIIIVAFIAYTFSAVSKPVSSFKYGFVAIVALVHDILIPTGIFALLGSFLLDYQIDVLFITALLAILGFSVNDTIVVFDRIRENLRLAQEKDKDKHIRGKDFADIVGKSLDQTFVRSFNTSLTTLIALGFLFFLGGEATRAFSLVLAVGVIAGTYSSLCIASPLLVWLESKQDYSEKPKKEKELREGKTDFSHVPTVKIEKDALGG